MKWLTKVFSKDVNERSKYREGFVFIEVLMAIFIFTFGFAGLYALTQDGVNRTQQSSSLLKAASLAHSILNEAGSTYRNDGLFKGYYRPGDVAEGKDGSMKWKLSSEWTEVPGLLKITVKVDWPENGYSRSHVMESLYFIHSGYLSTD